MTHAFSFNFCSTFGKEEINDQHLRSSSEWIKPLIECPDVPGKLQEPGPCLQSYGAKLYLEPSSPLFASFPCPIPAQPCS